MRMLVAPTETTLALLGLSVRLCNVTLFFGSGVWLLFALYVLTAALAPYLHLADQEVFDEANWYFGVMSLAMAVAWLLRLFASKQLLSDSTGSDS